MGSTWFECDARGVDAEEAFEKAKEEAEGSGYSDTTYAGNVLTKTDFIEIEIPPGVSPEEYVQGLDHHHPWMSKWDGIAGCYCAERVEDGASLYCFFGRAPC